MDPARTEGLRFVDDESDVSTLDVTDLTTPRRVQRSVSLSETPREEPKSRFKTLTLRRRDPDSQQEKKQKNTLKKSSVGLMRILSFGKARKKAKARKEEAQKQSVVREAGTDEEDFGSCGSLGRERPGSSQVQAPPENISVIELKGNRKMTDGAATEEASTDSFKSVEVSPELRNPGPVVRGSPITGVSTSSTELAGDSLDSFSDRSFHVFQSGSSFLEELELHRDEPRPQQQKKRSVLRLLKRAKSKKQDDADGMSQSTGAIKKEGKPRGRGGGDRRKDRKDEPEEEVLKKSAIIGQQLLQQKSEAEAEKKVTGDDLRKQLTEGLRTNGNGRKEQIRAITRPAVEKAEAETKQFIEREKSGGDGGEGGDRGEAVSDVMAVADSEGRVAGGEGVPTAQLKEVEPVKVDASHAEGKREHLYKILVIGELGTGKTSIIKRYVHQFFSQHYRATIGVDFALKVLNWDQNTIIRLQLWDIAGQERFGNMTRVYYKEAVGAFIVFDVTRAATFEAVQKWKTDLDSKVQLSDGSPIPCILLANKCDQPKEGLVNNKSKMDEYCSEKGFSSWYETSAKENINIEEAAKSLVNKILQNDKLVQNGDQQLDKEKFGLERKTEPSSGKSCSC